MTITLTTDNLPGTWRKATPTELLEGFCTYQNDETGYQVETIEEVIELEQTARAREYGPELLESAKAVLAAWDSGDLAAAVQGLGKIVQQTEVGQP